MRSRIASVARPSHAGQLLSRTNVERQLCYEMAGAWTRSFALARGCPRVSETMCPKHCPPEDLRRPIRFPVGSVSRRPSSGLGVGHFDGRGTDGPESRGTSCATASNWCLTTCVIAFLDVPRKQGGRSTRRPRQTVHRGASWVRKSLPCGAGSTGLGCAGRCVCKTRGRNAIHLPPACHPLLNQTSLCSAGNGTSPQQWSTPLAKLHVVARPRTPTKER
jgi:hypothetical protein